MQNLSKYSEVYKKDMEAYKEALSEYEQIVNSDRYKEVSDTMPFDFLLANQRVETLKMFHSVGAASKFHFNRADDAISFMLGFTDLRKNMDALLEDAAYIASAEAKAVEINRLVESSMYLPSNLKLPVGSFVATKAAECLKVLPTYPELLSRSFKKAYVESCIECLSISGLQKLVQAKLVSVKDIEVVRASGSKEYKEKVSALREMFGKPPVYYEKHQIKVVGTTFKNDDGSSRQEVLKRMEKAAQEGSVELTAKGGKWNPSPGVEKNKIDIAWNGQGVGFVPQGTVDAMYGKYVEPEFEATFKEVTGGGDVYYGCDIELGVLAKEVIESKEESTDKDMPFNS